MNSHIVKLSALGLAGITWLQASTMSVQAQQIVLTDNNSVAGVTVSLDAYAKNTQTGNVETSKSVVEASGDAALAAVNAVVAEEIQLNIKYDRLGIANVEESLNVRQKASTSSKIVGKMGKNAACNIEKVTKDGWAKIKSGNVTGYVSTEYLVMDEEAEELAFQVGKKMATVETQTLNARFLPSTESAKYTLVPNGEKLEVIRENISEEYVSKFISKHFNSKDTKAYISDVNQETMKEELDDWICVAIDNEKVFVAKEFVTFSYELERATSTETEGEEGNGAVSSVRSSMVAYAKQFIGNPYVYGGTSLTNGTDCSGFVMRIYEHFGYGLPRTSAAQAGATRTISSSSAKPGDLFFYGYGSSVSHVAMYIGNGLVVHASNERTGIKISNAYYRTPIKVGRVIND
ncbi:MAG: C40 family peptidase [Lachnospiraceae bacterium]|nr:C40 family peptidase [Lachnospiraceae bacterium]